MKKRKDFVEVVETSSKKISRPDIFGFLKEEPKQEPIVEEVKEPVEYKFNFKETVKEEKKVSRRNVFDILVEKPAEEPVQEPIKKTVEEVVEEPTEKIEEEPRIPRKKGQPAKSDKHSDLYTDEDPVGTIHGLGFKDVETAKASVKKINTSDRTHAHKVQAAVAMEQRAKEMGKTAEAAVFRKYIEKMKKITQQKHDERRARKKQKKEEVNEAVYKPPVFGPQANIISQSVDYLHNNTKDIPIDGEDVVEKTEYDLIREELNTLKKTIATQFGKMDYGSGEVRLEFLDDIDRDSAKVNNKYLRYNSSTGKWQGADASGDSGGGGISWQAVKTSDFNASAGEGYFINTTSGAVTATLPASPSLGDEIAFVDYAGTADTNAITIDRNGKPINSATENLNVATERAAFTLVFTDNTQGWVLKEKYYFFPPPSK